MDVVGSMYVLLFITWSCSKLVLAKADATTFRILKDPETLVSSNGIFMIGFFSPSISSNRYLGVWYNNKDSEGLEVTWVANRDNPLKDHSGMLKVSEDGNLQVLNGLDEIFWSSNVSSKENNATAQLLDSGNLVVGSSAENGPIIWQSFEHPTDSLLPPVKLTLSENMKENPQLRSWKSPSDPSSGRFSLAMNPRELTELFLWDGDSPYWRSGPWNGNFFIGMDMMPSDASVGLRLVDYLDGTYLLSYSLPRSSLLERFVLSYNGKLLQRDWGDHSRNWVILSQFPQSECDIFGKCGPFGSCDPNKSPICSCLRGYVPKNNGEWSKGNWTSGCERKTLLQCGNAGAKTDGFWTLKRMKVPDNAQRLSTNQDDCKRKCLEDCSCLAYAYYPGIDCMFWNESLIDIQQFSVGGAQIFIRLAHSELDETRKWKLVIAVGVIIGTAMVVLFMYYLWSWMSQRYGEKTRKQTVSHNYMFDDKVVQIDFHDLPLFDFGKLVVATNNFLGKNKLGQGGFGPVYKGILDDGQEIAVKRLSRASGQGLQEFMNEVVVISKLQHRNLVRLLGCCVEGEEKLLVYEYMPNKSLDALLFDPLYQGFLDWKKRFNIIKGICRGLLYLHRDSRLRIIHRDLKASNILLDEELNPKISDFGMARIVGGKQDQGNTLRIVGTYGYMSPEYAMEGRFSEKSDVFSLGVLLLEIVCGRRNCKFQDEESLSLLEHAWKLWNENDIHMLVDRTNSDPSYQGEISRCIHVGLLCVQEIPEDRPSVSTIISMLDTSKTIDVPHPTRPGFTRRKVSSAYVVPQVSRDHCSVNDVTLSVISGR